jgi:hypothetical protein
MDKDTPNLGVEYARLGLGQVSVSIAVVWQFAQQAVNGTIDLA